MLKFRCYRCKAGVSEATHKVVQMLMEMPTPEFVRDANLWAETYGDLVAENLNLFHCEGEEDLFDEEGRVVICPECFLKGIEQ